MSASPSPAEEARTGGSKHRIRRLIAAICLIVSCVLAPFAVIATWVKNELLDTDRYVATVAPLARNTDVTDYVAVRMTDRLMSSVDVQGLATEALPPRAEFLAGGIATGVRTFVEDASKRILASKQFAEIWDQANRTAHEQVRKALTGEGKSIKLQNGKVVLDLSQVMIAVRTNLSERGIGIFDKLPVGKTAIQLELFDAKGLESARQAVHYLVIGRIVLIVLAIGLAALGLFLSGDRRRWLARWGFGLALSLGIFAAAITFARGYGLDHLPEGGIPRDAAAAVFDATLHFLRLALRAGVVLGLLVALAATLAGPSRAAVRVREFGRAALDRTPAPNPGPFPRFVAAHKTALRITGVLVLLIAVLLGYTPRPLAVLVATFFLLIWLAIVEIIGRAGAAPAVSP